MWYVALIRNDGRLHLARDGWHEDARKAEGFATISIAMNYAIGHGTAIKPESGTLLTIAWRK